MQIHHYTPVVASSKNLGFLQSTTHSPWLSKDFLLFPN
jgi:hypothetical protein